MRCSRRGCAKPQRWPASITQWAARRRSSPKQTEFVKKVFDISVQGAREQAELSRQSTSEAVKIIQDRMKASLEEVRGSVSRAQPPKG